MRIANLFRRKKHFVPTEEVGVLEALNKAKAAMPERIVEAHMHCAQHREEIESSTLCGCFYCQRIFKPEEISEWIADGTCAMCPKCEIDAVIGDASGYPVTKKFLKEMNYYWFKK